MRKFFTAAMIFLLSVSTAYAAKWQTLIFTDDISASMNDLERYCITHDFTVKDILWANNISLNDIQAGTEIYVPRNQSEMLSIWREKGAKEALQSNTKRAASKFDFQEPERNIPMPQPVKVSEPREKVEIPEMNENNFTFDEGVFVNVPDLTEKNSLGETDNTELFTKLKEEIEEFELEPEQDIEQPEEPTKNLVASEPEKVSEPQKIIVENKPEEKIVAAQENKPEQKLAAAKPTQAPAPTPAPAQKKSDTPASVIAQTAKPDKILTAKQKKSDAEIPGLMDPIIILSPNGDSNGPMRLVISGDKVEVVRLPADALPKRPAFHDFSNTLGALPGVPPVKIPTQNNANNLYAPNLNLNGKMLWPVDGKVSSYFGQRGKRKHEGIDIPMPAGTPIRAAKTGTVSRTGNNSTVGFRGYGNFVLMDHGQGVQSFYAHCLKVIVSEGQRVMQGEIIGYVGCTGRSTANHLHFEVRVNNTKVNPMNYLAGNTHYASK